MKLIVLAVSRGLLYTIAVVCVIVILKEIFR